jgi:hypothetical protein
VVTEGEHAANIDLGLEGLDTFAEVILVRVNLVNLNPIANPSASEWT